MPRNPKPPAHDWSARSDRSNVIFAVLLLVLAAALFTPSIRYSLTGLDDLDYIVQNRLVTRGFASGSLRGAFDPSNTSATMYMPLLWLSYMADVTLFHASPRNPSPFHAVNVVLHALSAVCLFVLLRRLRATPPWAFLLALLWAVHPLRVESVAWVAERKDTLSAFLGLSATLCWLAAAGRSTAGELGDLSRDKGSGGPPTAVGAPSLPTRILFLSLSALLYAAGLLAKPSLVPLPLAWLALDVWPLRRIPASPRAPRFLHAAIRAVTEKLLFLPFALAAAWLAVARHHAVSGALAVPWTTRLAAIAPNFFFYVRKTLFPLHLSPLIPERWQFPPSTVFWSLLAVLFLVAVLWRFRHAVPSLLPGAAWVLLFFLPASGLQPLPMNTVADRFFYLPAIGISIALAALPAALSPRSRRFLHAAGAILLVPLALLSLRLLPIWSSDANLYDHILATFPGHPVAASSRAKQLIRDSGDFQRADALSLEALAQRPMAIHPALTHATCLALSGSPRNALDWLDAFPEPDSLATLAEYLFLRARLQLILGKPDEALATLHRALPLCPANSTLQTPILFCGLAAALDARDTAEALRFARKTRIFTDIPAVSMEHALPYAIFQWVGGFREDALHWFDRILEAYPDRLDLWNNVVWGLATASWSPADPADVLEKARHARSISPTPDHPALLDTMAAACANAGDCASATRLATQALDALPPDSPLALLIAKRLELYRQNLPYREIGFDRLFLSAFGPPETVF